MVEDAEPNTRQPNFCHRGKTRPDRTLFEYPKNLASPTAARRIARQGLAIVLFVLALDFRTFAAEPLPPERVPTVIESLTRLGPEKVEANPKLKEALERVLEATRGTPQFVELVRDFKVQDRDPELLEIAVGNPNNSTGVQAARLLLAHHRLDLLKGALAGSNAVQVAEALGNTAEKEIVPLLEPVVVDTSRDVALRRQTVLALAQVQDGAGFLLRLAREQKLPEDLKLVATSELNRARWANVKAEAAAILPPPQGQDARPLPPISELMKMPGDAARGAAVFRRDTAGCVKCHQVNGEGVDFGPNLSEIGAKLGKDALFQAILDPSAGISFGFEAWQIELKSGDETYGLIVSETADEIALKTPGNIVTRYKKSDIASREQQKLSIMPAGLQQTISTQDLVDLVEYLSSLKKASK